MTARTHLTRILASASRSRLGALNNAQFRSKSTTPKIFEEGSSKVEILRAGLKNDTRTLQDFIPSDAASVAQKKLSPAAEAALKDREEELHRSVLGQQKPDYARADGSFNRLRNIVRDPQFRKVKGALKGLELTTVCEEAKCPNIGECWGGETGTATATIMLMGDTCTRGCKFCNIKTSQAPPPIDQDEPRKVAEAVTNWGLDYVVLTSVDRDDMEDGGAGHFANTVKLLKQMDPNIKVEALVSDFQGNERCVATVVGSGLDVYAHNIETVERLQGRVRDRRAGYIQSIKTLEHAKSLNPEVVTKSSIMLGVGEKDEEVMQALRDLRTAGVEIVTFGQYLRPSRKHMRVYEYVDYDKYDYWRKQGESMGFAYVASSPLVRSSYKAGEFFVKAMIDQRRAAAAAQHA